MAAVDDLLNLIEHEKDPEKIEIYKKKIVKFRIFGIKRQIEVFSAILS